MKTKNKYAQLGAKIKKLYSKEKYLKKAFCQIFNYYDCHILEIATYDILKYIN